MPPKKSKAAASKPATAPAPATAAKSTSKKRKAADEPAVAESTKAKSVAAAPKPKADNGRGKTQTQPVEKAAILPPKKAVTAPKTEPPPKKTVAPKQAPAPKKTVVPLKKAPAPKKDPAPVIKPISKKRKAEEELDAPAPKKAAAPKKTAAPKKAPPPKKTPEPKAPTPKNVAAPKPKKAAPVINEPPTKILDIYVFGEGSAGELGLGAGRGLDGKSVVDVKRPRLNMRLSAKDVGVVQLATGGMHCAALTRDNKILTWGVNDQGALGRESAQGGKMKEVVADADSDSDDDSDAGSGLNPNEAEPREIDTSEIPEGTRFASVFAGDNVTYALTTDGHVYGWGSFRGNDGVLGFRPNNKQQSIPMLIPELKNITDITCGTNHVIALDTRGKIFIWGAGEQNQLGRRVVSRTATGALIPREFGLGRKKFAHIGSGDYHSFAITDKGEVWAWGLNTFGQTGVEKGDTGDEEVDNTVPAPTVANNLKGYDIKQIAGGAHHSVALTKKGEVLVFGRIDNNEGGMEVEDMPKENLYIDEHGRARYLIKPVVLEDIKGVYVATATDTSLAVSDEGKAYTWGFSTNYQAGQGDIQEVKEATWVDNTAVRGKKIVSGGIGGQFGVLCGEADFVMTNGI